MYNWTFNTNVSILRCKYFDGCTIDFSNIPRPFYIIAYIEKGNAIYKGVSATVELKSGDIFLIPQGETYTAKWFGEDDMSCISVFFTFPYQSHPLGNKVFPMQKIYNGNIKEIIYTLYDNYINSEMSFKDISDFYRLCEYSFSELKYEERKDTNQNIAKALEYINEHFNEKISVKKLAEICMLSEPHFYRQFKNATGTSPINYKNKLAISRAISLLLSNPDMSIDEISDMLGISSSVHFRNLLKKFTGKTPTDIKRSNMV